MTVAHVATGAVVQDFSGTNNTPAIVSPAGAIDDLLLCFLIHDDFSDGVFSNTDGALSWTAIYDGATQLGDDSNGGIFWAKEDQAASRTFDWTFTTAEGWAGVIIRYSGQHSTTPIQVSSILSRMGLSIKDFSADTLGGMTVHCIFSDGLFFDSVRISGGFTIKSRHSVNTARFWIADRLFGEDDYPYASVIPVISGIADVTGTSNSTHQSFNIAFVIAPAVTNYTLSGTTKDKDGNALGSCIVELWKETAGGDIKFVASTTSHASTGAYSFTVPNDTDAKFRTLAYKDDTPHVFDVTDRVLQPT